MLARARPAPRLCEAVLDLAGVDLVAAVQDAERVAVLVLRAHQDTVVSRGALRELGAQAGAENQNGYTFGVLHGRDEMHARAIEDRLAETWSRAGARKHRRWMR